MSGLKSIRSSTPTTTLQKHQQKLSYLSSQPLPTPTKSISSPRPKSGLVNKTISTPNATTTATFDDGTDLKLNFYHQ